MEPMKKSPLGLYTIGIAALFLAGFLMLVTLGAKTYCDTVDRQTVNNSDRALRYAATCIRANDSGNAVRIEQNNGTVLSVLDADTGYALRIYLYQGNLVEEYSEPDAALNPEQAQVIGETQTFEVQQMQEGLYAVSTDAGRILVHTRSKGA